MAASAARIAEVLAGLRVRTACLSRAPSSPSSSRDHIPLGLPDIDAALGGGLPRGRLAELSGPRSSGRLSLTLSALRAAQLQGECVALVDVADAFDPRSAADGGLRLDRLLWVRPRSLDDGWKAADRVLDAGGFALVVLYTCGVRGRWPSQVGARLLRRAERARSAVLVVGDWPRLGSFAAAALTVDRARACWSGGGAAPARFDGARGRVSIAHNKLGPPTGAVVLALGQK